MAITKNIEQLKIDILSEKYDIFVLEFPSAKAEFDRLKSSPGCGGCIRAAFAKMIIDPAFEAKLKLIYGDDVTVDKTMPAQHRPTGTEVHNVPLAIFDSWIADFLSKNHIRFMNTLYVSDTKMVKVIVQAMKMQ